MQFSGFMDPLMSRNTNWEIVAPKWNSQCYSTYSLNLFKVRLAHVSSAAAKTKGFGEWRERKGKTTFFFFFFFFSTGIAGEGAHSADGISGPWESKGSVQRTDNRK